MELHYSQMCLQYSQTPQVELFFVKLYFVKNSILDFDWVLNVPLWCMIYLENGLFFYHVQKPRCMTELWGQGAMIPPPIPTYTFATEDFKDSWLCVIVEDI